MSRVRFISLPIKSFCKNKCLRFKYVFLYPSTNFAMEPARKTKQGSSYSSVIKIFTLWKLQTCNSNEQLWNECLLCIAETKSSKSLLVISSWHEFKRVQVSYFIARTVCAPTVENLDWHELRRLRTTYLKWTEWSDNILIAILILKRKHFSGSRNTNSVIITFSWINSYFWKTETPRLKATQK